MVPWSPEPSRRETNDDMNGLGDRMRSVSPEGWDTLLTTLTPDPQPPSANSSFVSTVASQHAGASSSNTSLSEQLRPTEAAAEQPCEPGQDISDGENEEGTRTRAILRGPPRAMNPVRFNVPEYNTNGLLDMSATQRINEARDHRLNRARLNRARRLQEIPEDLWPRTNHGEERDGWVGQLSVGMSDDEQINSRSQLNREDSATSGNTGPTVDEELSGWQRIVRELAVRDDIPDEWWAEAGLSRTLTRDRL